MVFKLALLVSAAAALSAAPAKVFPYSYTQEDLPNGLRLVVVPTPFPNIVATYIVVQAGSRNEVEPGHTGFAHLFEHLMFKGTEKYPAAAYNEALQRMGATSNAYTTADYTCFYTVFSKEDLPKVMEMEADRFQRLKVSEPEFKTESLAVLGEYNKNASSPFSKLDEVVADTAYDRSTYKHTTMGFLKDIQDMPNQYPYGLQFFDRYYRPEYTTILVVGDVKTKAVHDLAVQYWGEWKRGTFKPEIPREPAQQAPRSAAVNWPTPTLPVLDIAYKGPAYSDSTKDTAALGALALLAFSTSSDLYQKLVIEEQRAASLHAEAPQNLDPSLFEVVALVKREGDLDAVRDRIYETIQTFRDQPVDAARLDAVRKHLRYSLANRMRSSDAIAAILAPYVALRRTPETLNLLYNQYDALTPQDIRNAAERFLTASGRTTVTLVGPPAAAAAEAK
ncbi:MAG TPA: pitrilysin family protein [Bryobacteraceae bacterium]|nr:pitrilysin family protein [Bryobacteraceae bacterium]